jgi:GNAT superfamily N-acetyltransferase
VTDPRKPALAPRDATRVKSVGKHRLPSDAFAHLPQPTIGPAMPGSIPMPRGHATEMKPRNAQFLENILRAAHEFGPTGAMAQAFGAGQDARSAVRERSPLKAVGALASLGLAAIPEGRGARRIAHELSDAYKGQKNFLVRMHGPDDAPIGVLDYTLFDGELSVNDVVVRPEFRRQGIATELYERMLAEHPGAALSGSMTTPDGTAFRSAFNKSHPDRVIP